MEGSQKWNVIKINIKKKKLLRQEDQRKYSTPHKNSPL